MTLRLSRWHDRSLPYLLIAPTVAVLVALSIYPLLYAIKVAFQTGSGESARWTFANFARLSADSFFLSALWHTLVYATVALTFEFLLGLGLAVLLDRPLRGRSVFRAILLIPMMLPPVVVGIVWRLMLNPDFGAVNGTLKSVGMNTDALTWTASPKLALLSVIAVDVWQWTPFMFLVLLAGLQAIPQEPYEAAMIDGASAWQTFLHVTLPMLRPAILIERQPPFHERAAPAAHHVDDFLEVGADLIAHPRAARVLCLVLPELRVLVVQRQHRARGAAVAVPGDAGHPR